MLSEPEAFMPRDCRICPIRRQAICARCAAADLRTLDHLKYRRSFRAGETIVWSGEKMDFVGSVVQGVASLSQTLEGGRRQMVGLLLPSDFVGRPGRSTAAYDVVATRDVEMCCFRKEPFEAMMVNTPHVAERLLEMTLDELDSAREWMLVLGRKTARERIASFLVSVARRYSTGNCAGRTTASVCFDLPLTREEMADYLSLTHETVSRQISALKRDGVIRLKDRRHVSVADFKRLLAEAGNESDCKTLV